MANFTKAVSEQNEIIKAEDISFGHDSSVENIMLALGGILAKNSGNFVIGGKVSQIMNNGLSVSVAPILVYEKTSGKYAVESEIATLILEDVQLADRIDTIQAKIQEIGFDPQNRVWNDPATGVKRYEIIDTKKKIKVKISVKKGTEGENIAPSIDEGCVKIAEIVIHYGTDTIEDSSIKNITARKDGEENSGWTNEQSSTFNIGYIADNLSTFLNEHNENGSHKEHVIKSDNIDFGTGSRQISGKNIPIGMNIPVYRSIFQSQEKIDSLIKFIADNITKLYPFSNNILGRYEFIDIVPVACSTDNVDVSLGGEKNIDGIVCREGQTVFLKDQNNKIENGLWIVNSRAWSRHTDYNEIRETAFSNKLVKVKNGNINSNKIFYLDDDSLKIGIDKLNFREATFLSELMSNFVFMTEEEVGALFT